MNLAHLLAHTLLLAVASIATAQTGSVPPTSPPAATQPATQPATGPATRRWVQPFGTYKLSEIRMRDMCVVPDPTTKPITW